MAPNNLPMLEMGRVSSYDSKMETSNDYSKSSRRLTRDEIISRRLYTFKIKLTESQMMKIQ